MTWQLLVAIVALVLRPSPYSTTGNRRGAWRCPSPCCSWRSSMYWAAAPWWCLEPMARRGGVILDLSWVHADATHNRFNQFITYCQQQVAADVPGADLSINMNVDQSEALVKVTALPTEINSLPGVVRNAIIRVYTEADHHEALAMVTAEAWTGPPEPGA